MCRSNVSKSVNTYASAASWGRFARVVHERLNQSCSSRRTSSLTIVPFPTPPGPETTMISGLPKLLEERRPLLRTKALNTAIVGNANVFHDSASFDFADAGKRFEHRDDFQLAHVAVVGVERLAEADRTHFEPSLDVGTRRARLGRLGERCGPLLRCQLRRSTHVAQTNAPTRRKWGASTRFEFSQADVRRSVMLDRPA